MIKKTVTFTDYNGFERTEDFYFNLTKAEVMTMQYSTAGGLDVMLKKLVATNDMPSIIKVFKELVLNAYGVKSPDGRKFIKNDEVRADFEQTEAYSIIFMELATDEKLAAEFINGIVPKDLADGANVPSIAPAAR